MYNLIIVLHCTGKHALTKIAKGIVKICKEDVSICISYNDGCHSIVVFQVREIELCPSCYGLAVKQPVDWFCIPCVSCVLNLKCLSYMYCTCSL